MKRRDFLRNTVTAATLTNLLGGFSVQAFGASPFLNMLTNASAETDHVLVMIQLAGGNDGLNTIIPLDQYANLATVRKNVLIPQNQVLALNGTSTVGMHPNMGGMQQMYNNGLLNIIQSVGYPNPDFSHFRSTDIWLTGSDSNQVLNTGWTGRYLNYEYPNYPVGYPNTSVPDPLAMQIGSSLSTIFQGPGLNMGLSISDPTNFYNLINGIQDPAPNTPAGTELSFIRLMAKQTDQYATVIKTAANNITTQGAYPSNNTLADQLKIVARLIAGGLKTRLYLVNLPGFDTHSKQVSESSTTSGIHADLLQKLSDAMKAFTDDLNFLGAGDRVIGMTFSEFGRRIKSNSGLGTDHGAAAPLFVFGNKVIPGILGSNPTISSTVTINDNLPMQYDFRSVYASLLQDWFCVPSSDLNSLLLSNFQSLPLVDSSYCNPLGAHAQNKMAGISLVSNYPNPFTSSTTISYQTTGGHTLLQVFNGEGHLIKTLVDAVLSAGEYKIWFENEGYAEGIYYVRLQNNALQQVQPMLIVRG